MTHVSDEQFDAMLQAAIEAIPEQFAARLDNVAFVIADEPTPEQLASLGMDPEETLFGLYEGISLPERSENYSAAVPDTITLFKSPLEEWCQNEEELRDEINETVWHEVGHYFGLDHEAMDALHAEAHSAAQQEPPKAGGGEG